MVRILVVDDEELVRDFIGHVLKAGGWPDVTLAGSGAEAFQLLHRDRYSLCITDLFMPGMDGIELLRKAKEEGIATDFLFFTGDGTIESAVAATKCGAQDFLPKPKDPVKLIAIVRRILRRHQPVPHVLAERMDAFLASHLEAPDLGVADLCRQFKVTARHVSPGSSTTTSTLPSPTASPTIALLAPSCFSPTPSNRYNKSPPPAASSTTVVFMKRLRAW